MSRSPSLLGVGPVGVPGSLRALVQGFAERTITPVTALTAYLDRIALLDCQYNSYSLMNLPSAMRGAELSTQRWSEGRPLSPMDGVPISVKDMLPVAGLPTRCGSLATPDEAAAVSAPVVARLEAAGAVIVGTTTTAEFGSAAVTISPLTGITRNARNPARTAGGSSGGAAVSVAAGLCAAAIATDTGGSIRIPASFNGVVGLKPTGGRLPTSKANPLRTLSCPGPIARSVADCAHVFASMADRRFGSDDPSYPDLSESPHIELRDVSFAMSMRLGYARHIHPEVELAIRQLVALLRDHGCQVREVEPEIADPFALFQVFTRTYCAAVLSGMAPESIELLGPAVRAALNAGRELKVAEYLAAQAERIEFANTLDDQLGPYDILITPAVAVPPFAAERFMPEEPSNWQEYSPSAWCPFGYPLNLSCQPALSLPCGTTRDGLPIGCQLAARVWREPFLLAVAAEVEALLSVRNIHACN